MEATASGGVVAFRESEYVVVADCDLYGSGTVGVGISDSRRITIERSKIHDCTYQIASVHGSTDVRFDEMEFANNREFNLVEVDASSAVTIANSAFRDNLATSEHYPFLHAEEGGSLVVRDTTFEANRAVVFKAGPVRLERVSYVNNRFQ